MDGLAVASSSPPAPCINTATLGTAPTSPGASQRICDKHPGNPTVTDELCGRRYLRAVEDKFNTAFDLCRECESGKAHSKDVPARPVHVVKEATGVRLCKKCGTPTNDKLCAHCKVERNMAMNEATDVQRNGNGKQEKSGKLPCIVDGCSTPRVKKRLCGKHFKEEHGLSVKQYQKAHPENWKTAEKMSAFIRKEQDKRITTMIAGVHIPPQEPVKRDGHMVGQWLYIARLVDDMLAKSLEGEALDVKAVLSVRRRLGIILEGALSVE